MFYFWCDGHDDGCFAALDVRGALSRKWGCDNMAALRSCDSVAYVYSSGCGLDYFPTDAYVPRRYMRCTADFLSTGTMDVIDRYRGRLVGTFMLAFNRIVLWIMSIISFPLFLLISIESYFFFLFFFLCISSTY